jgi:hypothetical protein
MGQNERST